MKVINFLLHTKQPILATSLQGNPNSDVSFDYILGGMIRGALISRYINSPQNNIQKTDDILDSESFPEIKRLFFDASKTRYLNAYPVSNNKQRALPVPLSLYKNKGDEFSEEESEYKSVYDFSKIPVDDKDEYLPDDLSPKLLNDNFCTVDDEEIIIHRVKRRINIHNQRDRKRGKGTDSNGAVFSYDAIDAEQTFQSVILCDSEEDKAIIESLLQPQDIWLGGSQSAGYGHTIIELIPSSDNWSEVSIDLVSRLQNKESLTITLLSDTILRDSCGQYAALPEVFSQNISRYLKLDLDNKLKFQDNGIYSSSIIVGGFNRTWGLPLPQTPALAAGSVFVFKKSDVDLHQLQELEKQGIGERRTEGFGRIVINWLDEDITEYKVTLNKPEAKNNNESESLSPDSIKIVEDITIRIVRKRLDILLTKKVASTEIIKGIISNSQLSRLMIITRKSLAQLEQEINQVESSRKTIKEIAEPITTLLKNLPSNARSQFERTYLNTDKRLDEQINEWLKSPNYWINKSWLSEEQTKNLVENNKPHIKIANVPKSIDDYLSLEYTLHLIIAITKKALKEKNND
jgi:CRISPR-associated protein Csx10